MAVLVISSITTIVIIIIAFASGVNCRGHFLEPMSRLSITFITDVSQG